MNEIASGRSRIRILLVLLHTLAAGSFVLALVVFYFRSRPLPPRAPAMPFLAADRPLVFGHRGAAAHGAENMLPAFRRAAATGAEVLELDVHRTADGVVVVLHDESLLRTAGVDRAVNDLTFAELSRIDNGAMFQRFRNGDLRAPREQERSELAASAEPSESSNRFPLRGKGLRVPALEAVFREFPGHRVNIEIKRNDALLVRALWELIQKQRRQDTVLVGSRHAEALAEFRRLSGGRVATGATLREAVLFWLCFRVDVPCRPDYVALQLPWARGFMARLPGPLRDIRGPAFIAFAHEQGLKVHYWTVNRPEDMRELLNFGADGIITDYPERAAAIINDRNK